MSDTHDTDLSPEDRELLRAWQAGPGPRPTAEDGARWLEATRAGRVPTRSATPAASDGPVGDDGLTDAERADHAREYAEGAAKTPSREQLASYRALGEQVRASREARGNDGLTDAERHESAERWRNGAGKAPDKAEMARLRVLTPVTYKPRNPDPGTPTT